MVAAALSNNCDPPQNNGTIENDAVPKLIHENENASENSDHDCPREPRPEEQVIIQAESSSTSGVYNLATPEAIAQCSKILLSVAFSHAMKCFSFYFLPNLS